MMNNQYVILGIAETASDNEIRRALKNQIERYCGRDNNGKNADGNYLQSIFLQAAKDLLDSNKRAKIDAEIKEQRLKNGVVPFVGKETKKTETTKAVASVKPETSTAVEKSVVIQPKREIVKPVVEESAVVEAPEQKGSVVAIVGRGKIKFFNTALLLKSIAVAPYSFFGMEYPLDSARAIIGEDGSFMFAQEWSTTRGNYTLSNIFTDENCLGGRCYVFKDRPYADGKIFEINGIQSICVMGSKFIPVNMIRSGSISSTNLKRVSNFLVEYFASNPQVIEGIFGKKEDQSLKTYYAQPNQR